MQGEAISGGKGERASISILAIDGNLKCGKFPFFSDSVGAPVRDCELLVYSVFSGIYGLDYTNYGGVGWRNLYWQRGGSG